MLAVLVLLTMAQPADLDSVGWKAVFESYSRQSPQGQRRILASIVPFSNRFTNIAATIAGCPSVADRVQALSAIMIAEFPKDKLEKGRVFDQKVKDLVDPMEKTLQRGLASKDLATRSTALDTLFKVSATRFRPRKDPYVICRSVASVHTSLLTSVISRTMREQALVSPRLFIRTARAGNRAAAISLAESRVVAAKSVLTRLLENDKTFVLGCECAIAWPTPELLPKLLARVDSVDYNQNGRTFSVFQNALLGYGVSALAAFQSKWTTMSNLGKRTALDVAFNMPNRLSVTLALRALREPSPEVRLLAVAVAKTYLQDFPFRSSYMKNCPDDLVDTDKAKVREAVTRLQTDSNPKVAEAARAVCRIRF